LPETQRATLWAIFERTLQDLRASGLLTYAAIFTRLATAVKGRQHPPFTSIVVDEAQDISITQLHFLAAVGGERQNALFFAGDLGQRIFQTPFSWRSLGVDIRGRSRTLTINYRTSHQIRNQADRLLAPAIADVDGVIEERKGTISVFNGPAPEIYTAQTKAQEAAYVANWLKKIIEQGITPDEIGVFVRSSEQFARAIKAIEQAGLSFNILDTRPELSLKQVTLGTMHQAKGLEFKAVAVMACDDEIIPLQERMEEVTDDTEIEDFYNTERHLLYVAITRARDLLLVTSVEPKSEFIDDLLLV
jgi:superfamily I DNA/RNA helicase